MAIKLVNTKDPSKVVSKLELYDSLIAKYPEDAEHYRSLGPDRLLDEAVKSGAWSVQSQTTEAPPIRKDQGMQRDERIKPKTFKESVADSPVLEQVALTPAVGVANIGEGFGDLTNKENSNDTRAGGAAKMIGGAMEVGTPLLPGSLVKNTFGTIIGLARAVVGAGVGEGIANMLGAGPGVRDLTGAAGGLTGGLYSELPSGIAPDVPLVGNKAIGTGLDKVGKWQYEKSFRFPADVENPVRDRLIARGIETGQTLGKEEDTGAANRRYGSIASGLKKASKEATKRGALIEPISSQEKVVKLSEETADPDISAKIDKKGGKLLERNFPGGRAITPDEAEVSKEKMNKTLDRFLTSAKRAGSTKASVGDETMNAVLNGIKDQQESKITELVDTGEGDLLPYRKAARVAADDKDIAGWADLIHRQGRSSNTGATATEGAATVSLLGGNPFAPSVAGLWNKNINTPKLQSRMGLSLIEKGKELRTGKIPDKSKPTAKPAEPKAPPKPPPAGPQDSNEYFQGPQQQGIPAKLAKESADTFNDKAAQADYELATNKAKAKEKLQAKKDVPKEPTEIIPAPKDRPTPGTPPRFYAGDQVIDADSIPQETPKGQSQIAAPTANPALEGTTIDQKALPAPNEANTELSAKFNNAPAHLISAFEGLDDTALKHIAAQAQEALTNKTVVDPAKFQQAHDSSNAALAVLYKRRYNNPSQMGDPAYKYAPGPLAGETLPDESKVVAPSQPVAATEGFTVNPYLQQMRDKPATPKVESEPKVVAPAKATPAPVETKAAAVPSMPVQVKTAEVAKPEVVESKPKEVVVKKKQEVIAPTPKTGVVKEIPRNKANKATFRDKEGGMNSVELHKNENLFEHDGETYVTTTKGDQLQINTFDRFDSGLEPQATVPLEGSELETLDKHLKGSKVESATTPTTPKETSTAKPAKEEASAKTAAPPGKTRSAGKSKH